MNRYLDDEKTSWLAFLACFIAYTVISMTKNTYSTAIAAIVSEGLFSKANAGVINASFYLFYGMTQFAGGYLADKISPFKIILITLLGCVVVNSVMAMSDSFVVMLIAWSVNGVFQFGLWPAVIKIISSVLLYDHRKKAMVYIAFCFPLGTVCSYLLAMGVLKSWRWPMLFWTSVIVLIPVVFLVLFVSRCVDKKTEPETVAHAAEEARQKEKEQPSASFAKIFLTSGLFLICIPALVRCMLDIGLKTWVPTMIMESYGVSPSTSSMLTTVLIFLNLTGVFFTTWLYPKRCKSLPLAIGLFFLVSLPLLGLLLFNGTVSVMIIVLLLALMTTMMTAASQLLNVNLPAAFGAYKKIGMVAGISNAFGCFGCMLANYLYGFTAQAYGWTVTIMIWIALALIAFLFCILAMLLWNRFMMQKEQ